MADSPAFMHMATLGGAVRSGNAVSYRIHPTDLLARVNMWVHRCVTLNAQVAASVPCRLYMVDRTGSMVRTGKARALDAATKAHVAGRRDLSPAPSVKAAIRGYEDDLVEITEHPVLDLLQSVNRWTEGYGYRESVYADLQIFGRAFTLLVGTGDQPEALWRMLPTRTKVLPDPEEFVRGFEYGQGTETKVYLPDEVLWFRLFDPADPWQGLGPLEAWLPTVDAMRYVALFQRELFERGGAPDWIVTSKRDLGESQKRSFAREWVAKFGRLYRRAQSVGFLGGEDVDIRRLTDSPRELEFTQSADQLRDQVGQAFGVPKAMLTADDVNRSNAKEASDAHMRLTIWPMVQRVEDALNEQLVRLWDERLFLMHENPIRGDLADLIADRESKLRSGYSINEIRIEAGDEPIEDEYADVPLVGSGLTSLERAVDPPGMDDMGGEDDEDDDGPDDGEDMPEPDEPDDEAEEPVIRGLRFVQPVFMNGCGCNGATSQRAMWTAAATKAEESRKPDEIDEPTRRLQRSLAAWFLRRLDDTIDALGPEGTALPGIDVVLPDTTRAAEEAEVARIARPHVEDAVRAGADDAIRELGSSISFDMDNQRVLAFLDDETRVIGRVATDAYRREIRDILLEAHSTGRTVAEVARDVRTLTEKAPYQAERIARTEIGYAATHARDQAFAQLGVRKKWLLSADACPLCEAMAADFNAEAPPAGEPFLKAGDGRTYTFNDGGTERTIAIDYRDIIGGDAHPNCRCTIIADIGD